MEYRRLGNSGLKISALSLGGWTTFGGSVKDQDITRQIMVKAYESGVNFFDIADIYATGEAEKMMGAVLNEFPRHTLVISSKVFWPMSDDVNDRGLSRKHIFESIHKSLKRIGTDYLDIYFCHRYDAETPLEETIRAMDDLVHQGKILYWGTSEWTGAQIAEAAGIARRYNLYPPQVEQPQYNLLHRRIEQEIIPVTSPHGMGLVTWSPLASGLLTGKYDNGVPPHTRLADIDWLREGALQEDRLARVRALKPIADGLGMSRALLALAWALRRPEISSVITGATRPEQLEGNLKALDAVAKLGEDVLKKLDEVCPPGA